MYIHLPILENLMKKVFVSNKKSANILLNTTDIENAYIFWRWVGSYSSPCSKFCN